MIIKQADNNDQSRWDAYIKDHPHAVPYHSFSWKTSVETAYGHKGYYLIAEEDQKICGILPLITMNLLGQFNRCIALPFCDFADVLADDEQVREKLLLHAVAVAKTLKAKYFEARCSQNLEGLLKKMPFPIRVQSHKVSMILTLPESSEKLWQGFKTKTRTHIRKSALNGLTFKWGDLSELDLFYKIFSHNMKDLGSPVHSKKWFRAILESYKDFARMGLIYYERVPIGGSIILMMNKMLSVPWSSSLREFNRLGTNMSLYWNLLKYASDNGFSHFDFGRSTYDEGTYLFKSQWGAKPEPIYWYTIQLKGETKTDPMKKDGLSKRKLAENLWKKLPYPVATLLGPYIRKHISL